MPTKKNSASRCGIYPVSQKFKPPDVLGQEQMVSVSLPSGTLSPPTSEPVATMQRHQSQLKLGKSAGAREGPGF